MQIKLPEKVITIIEQLQDEGYEAYAVGGCVRDSLLSKEPNDWDITTNALPMDIKRLFRRTVDIGIEHGTVKVMLGEDGYEITTYRIDGKYLDSRHPESVTFTASLEEDLKRRDFTMNAMAYNERDGLIDLFDGQGDMEKGIVRAVGDASKRFDEDALRIMRAVRFAAQLGYEIEKDTYEAAVKLAPTLKNISAERIRDEIEKLIISDHPEKMRDLYEMGITKVILPDWDTMMECEQNSLHHYLNVGDHTICALNYAKDYRDGLSDKEKRNLMLATLLHDIAKPLMRTMGEDGHHHFKGHPKAGVEMAANVLRNLKYDNATIEDVKKLVLYHDERVALTEYAVRKLIVGCGPERMEMLFRLKWADLKAHSDYQMDEKRDELEKTEALYRQIIENGDCLSIKELAINGRDLMEIGYKSGPKLGEMLNELFDTVLKNPSLNNREELTKIVSESGKIECSKN